MRGEAQLTHLSLSLWHHRPLQGPRRSRNGRERRASGARQAPERRASGMRDARPWLHKRKSHIDAPRSRRPGHRTKDRLCKRSRSRGSGRGSARTQGRWGTAEAQTRNTHKKSRGGSVQSALHLAPKRLRHVACACSRARAWQAARPPTRQVLRLLSSLFCANHACSRRCSPQWRRAPLILGADPPDAPMNAAPPVLRPLDVRRGKIEH